MDTLDGQEKVLACTEHIIAEVHTIKLVVDDNWHNFSNVRNFKSVKIAWFFFQLF